ncbi:hypothetical protein DTX80_17205 [Bacilli bacterium]|uniref:hypothetical protein n=1 Tax=Oceanobacillus TaxID=182709 RepID=UPI000621DDFC|nr:hypothetical protein [Oceanobacillus caeni]KKE79453.1 hypothetical protein WH51_07215 [Bacilli bacterium VT-13-104]PZD81421.1 hypothetical protein DEJ64_17405 [Bacilli bacterium]MBU8792530.1 hypothetical protein [Oceanobacillus caeni]PZD83308.1 hypothetical protein DEJ60_17440 [Bacilli bacterium]PZD84835.1 hypothetical protein DEJ66_17405 [Bacilli bacterium]
MKKRNIEWALFTGLFVGIVIFLSEILIPNANFFISMAISGLSALIGGLIGNKIRFSQRKAKKINAK